MEICFVASNYTTDKRQVHVFLDNVVRLLADRGVKVSVIAPQSSFAYYTRKSQRRPMEYERYSPNGVAYKVYSPLYTVFPKIRFGSFSISDRTKYSFFRAVRRVYKANGLNADVIYSHFIQAGIAGVMLAQELGVPSFIANGEADTIESLKYISPKLVKSTLDGVTGIISVSTKCRDEVYELCGGDKKVMDKVVILPNAANTERFRKIDRLECRRELGFPEDAFIISFTGSFISRKGIGKVAEAVNSIEGVYAVFIGVGDEEPKCRNILFKGRVKNEEVVKYLNASDVFVLPTLAEGCSNAIVEAVACGLPIISSDRSFNWDVLDDSCAILIDPEDTASVVNAVRELKNDPEKRKRLAEGSMRKARSLSLDGRVDGILRLLNKTVEQYGR